MAAVQVAGNHERQGRAAFAGIRAKAGRYPSGQAGQIAIAAVQDLPLMDNDVFLQAVLQEIAAQAVEIRRSHCWKNLGTGMDRQTLLGHDALHTHTQETFTPEVLVGVWRRSSKKFERSAEPPQVKAAPHVQHPAPRTW
jgi:hypothetical protein